MHRALGLLLLLSPITTASSQIVPTTKKLKFLTSAETDPSRLLPPPPPDGSESQLADMADLKRVVQARTPQRFAQAQWDNEHEDPTAFSSVIGPNFDLKALPATAKLLADTGNDLSVAVVRSKNYFRRRFAAVIDPSLVSVNCDPAEVKANAAKPGGRVLASYPSGHATMGFTFGFILANLMPEKSQAILARAADYGYSREVCAEHYRADVEASHALGTALAVMFLNNSALKPEIEAARDELRAAHVAK